MTIQEQNNCCGTTEDGSLVCHLPQNGEKADCSCQTAPVQEEESKGQVRRIGLFLLACLSSPCCTPLFVPVVLSLFAGTSFALWLSENLFWVYGLLSILSIFSFVLALRKPSGRKAQEAKPKNSPLISISSIQIGEKAHADSRK